MVEDILLAAVLARDSFADFSQHFRGFLVDFSGLELEPNVAHPTKKRHLE